MVAQPPTNPDISPCRFNDRIIELTGVSGGHGRVGALEGRVKKLENMQFRLVLLTASGAGIGGGIVAGLVKVFAG